MKCPFCQNEMGGAQTECPACKRPHSPYVAYQVTQAWNELKRDEQQKARAAFTEALRVTPSNDRQQLETYISFLVEQAGSTSPAATAAAVTAAAAVSQPKSPRPASASQPGQAGPGGRQPATVSAPAPQRQASQTDKGAAGRKLFLNFNEKPINIVHVMDDAVRKQDEFGKAYTMRLWFVALLLPAGAPFVLFDLLMGYNALTFSLVAYVLWGAALVGMIVLWRNRAGGKDKAPGSQPSSIGSIIVWIFLAIFAIAFCGPFLGSGALAFLFISPPLAIGAIVSFIVLIGLIALWRGRPTGQVFGPQYSIARTIFETIRDDVAPKRTLMGLLDLTGMHQPSKVYQERTSGSGMPIAFYRDEWLRMKMQLYDGNVMRVSVVERSKSKLGRWKRGRTSGKMKWKAGGTVWARKEMKVAITVNREAYRVLPFQEKQAGKFMVDATGTDDSRIVLKAQAVEPIGAADILGVLRFAYDHLKPREMAAV